MRKNEKNNKNNKLKNKISGSMKTDRLRFRSLVHNLKKLFLPWIILSVVSASAIVGMNIMFSENVNSVNAVIAFYYNGIEDGLDPNGCEFSKSLIKNDDVISRSLDDLGLSQDLLKEVQDDIFIESIVSTTAIGDITNYKSIYDSNASKLSESINDSSYHPTSFSVTFNYNDTGIDGKTASQLLNSILENFNDYFVHAFGYNTSVGNSVLSVDFSNYDYLIALEMYSSKLDSLSNYVDTISKNEKSQFRSDVTGYSFSDLKNSLDLIRNVDIDTLSSYILKNGVISNKNVILSYYNYRLNNIKRSKENAEERLDSMIKSISDYQKDSLVIYDSASNSSTNVTQTSEIYDQLIQNKIQIQSSISYYDRIISDYTYRIDAIKKSSSSASDKNRKYVDSQLQQLSEKTKLLVENIEATANDYYSTEKFSNAVSITSSSEYSLMYYFKSAINQSIRMLTISELVLLTIYLLAAILFCVSRSMHSFFKIHFANI